MIFILRLGLNNSKIWILLLVFGQLWESIILVVVGMED